MRHTYGQWIVLTASATPFAMGPCEALYVGTAGTIVVTMTDGTSVTIVAAASTFLPIKATALTNIGAATVHALYA